MPRKKKKEKREAVPFEIDPKKLKEFVKRVVVLVVLGVVLFLLFNFVRRSKKNPKGNAP